MTRLSISGQRQVALAVTGAIYFFLVFPEVLDAGGEMTGVPLSYVALLGSWVLFNIAVWVVCSDVADSDAPNIESGGPDGS